MEDHPQNKNCKGLIAQEAEAVSSDLVETDDSEHGIKSINQGALTTMLIKAIQEHYNQINITISAQVYLKNFYESHGFIKVGEEYLEDGIPHIRMDKSK